MANEKDWKIKYFDSLKQLEDMETTWYKLEKLLRKAVSRLAITAKGINEQLDVVLQKIQQSSRDKDDAALEANLEELANLLTRIETPQVEQTSNALDAPLETARQQTPHEEILQLIDKLHFEGDYQSRIDELKRSIKDMDSHQCLDNLAQILNELLLQEVDDTDSIRALLVSLIEKISLAHGNSEQLSRIQARLEKDFTREDWDSVLDDIIAEIQRMIRGINEEKVEMESLIVDVTRQLNEISDVLTDEQSDTDAGRKDVQQLQSLMSQRVEDIQASVSSETDIARLKSSIEQNLGSIKSGVEQFIAKDKERYNKAEQRNKKLQQQIQAMERESDELQKKLNENRQKLMYDTLTGVRSRLSYDEVLEQELQRFERYHEPFSFAILDIDHFKRVNDRFGHNAGDKALQIVAKMMSRHIRKTDFLFRIGGEEFVLILPKTSLQNARPLVESIRSSVGGASFHFKKEKVDISLSAGLTEMGAQDNAETIYERADRALYDAKEGGRDQLVVVPAAAAAA